MAEEVSVHDHGPFFDGRAEYAAHLLCGALVGEIAKAGVPVVQSELDQVLQHPTGYYRSQIQVTHLTRSGAVIEDGGVVYGPWLAGTGSRNATTRFKGYAHWRRATARLKGMAQVIADKTVAEYVRRMN